MIFIPEASWGTQNPGIIVEAGMLERAVAEYGPECLKANAGNAERMPDINSAMPFVNLLPDRGVH